MVATQGRKTTVEVPPLENGDHLTRIEFERRYATMPAHIKAELIEGVVYLPAAVRIRKHAQPHHDLITWTGVYRALTPGVMGCDNATVRLDADNEPQPDILLRIEKGGQSRISEDDYLEGAPELAVEIAASSASYDLHDKKNAYRRNGVQEYVVWEANNQRINWFSLQAGEYVSLEPDEKGILRSQVFPGLWLDVQAFVTGDMNQVLETLRVGINSQAHQDFVKKLS
ncbi:MAG: Uma2 family endonuclease [Phormidesmis sp.]